MKTLFTLLSVWTLSVAGYAQQTESREMFYILDSYYFPNRPHVPIYDNSPNYFQMSGDEAIITGRIRNSAFTHQGEVLDYAVTDSVTSFYVLGNQFSIGRIASFEIFPEEGDNVRIHLFNKASNKVDMYFYAHPASEEEIEKIRSYWAGERW